MDWNKLGSIGSFVSGIFGVVTFIVAVWPYPQIKAALAAKKTGKQSHVIRIPKMIAIPVVASLILSSLSIYAAWHPVARFEYPPDFQHLEKIDCDDPPYSGKKFVNETVELDGKEFLNCNFVNVRLLFRGNQTFAIQHNVFDQSIVFATDNHAVAAYGEMLAVSGALGTPDKGVTWGSDKETFWVKRAFPLGTMEPVGAPTRP
jgi:hypothetical protein